MLEVDLPMRTPQITQKQVATETRQRIPKLLVMQDNSEESIRKWEEGSDQLICDREERDEKWEWEPKFEKIEGIKPEQDNVTP